MTKPIDPYSRVYWRVLGDERFDTIRADMRHFGSWTLMLLVADMAYPAPAFVPSTVPKASLAALVEAGLIEPVPGGLYRVHGLAAERSRRWSPRVPDGTPTGAGAEPVGTAKVPERSLARATAEPSLAETSQAEPAREDALDTYYALTLRYPAGRVKEWLSEIAAEFGHREAGQALAKEYIASNDVRTLLSRTEARLRSEAHHAELERAKPKPRPKVTPEEQARQERERVALIREWTSQVKDVPA
jgi:hypothetical protein